MTALAALIDPRGIDLLLDLVSDPVPAVRGSAFTALARLEPTTFLTVLAGLEERRRELAVLRAVGAAPRHVLLLLAIEGTLVTLAGVALGALSSIALVALARPWIQAHYGVTLNFGLPTPSQWQLLAAVLAAGLVASLVPGLRAYRLSLADGLAPRS